MRPRIAMWIVCRRAAFIDEYYNGTRLHSVLDYEPPNEFERGIAYGPSSGTARLQFLDLTKDGHQPTVC